MLQSYTLESPDIINPLNFKFQRIFSPPAPRLAVQCVSVSVHWVEINFSTNLVIARQSFFICVEDELHHTACCTAGRLDVLGKLRLCSLRNTGLLIHFWHQCYSSLLITPHARVNNWLTRLKPAENRHFLFNLRNPDCRILHAVTCRCEKACIRM